MIYRYIVPQTQDCIVEFETCPEPHQWLSCSGAPRQCLSGIRLPDKSLVSLLLTCKTIHDEVIAVLTETAQCSPYSENKSSSFLSYWHFAPSAVSASIIQPLDLVDTKHEAFESESINDDRYEFFDLLRATFRQLEAMISGRMNSDCSHGTALSCKHDDRVDYRWARPANMSDIIRNAVLGDKWGRRQTKHAMLSEEFVNFVKREKELEMLVYVDLEVLRR